MRLLAASIMQETNTFNPVSTKIADFERSRIVEGEEVKDMFSDANIEMAGFIDVARERHIDLHTAIRTFAFPSGKLTRATFELIKQMLIRHLDKAPAFDGVLLSLHGAMVAQDTDDCEGALLSEVRSRVPVGVPIVCSLDLHANITKSMVENCQALVGYKTCPHVDLRETGRKTANLALDTVLGKVKPSMSYVKLPMFTPAEKHNTSSGPLATLSQRARSLEKGRVLDVSIFPVQPWLDVEEMGWSVVAVTDGEPELAGTVAKSLARDCWSMREEFFVDKTPVGKALQEGSSSEESPVIISDSSDATNSGAPGDSTVLLRRLLRMKLRGRAMLTVVDPDAVRVCIRAGVGRDVTLKVGGKRDSVFSSPLKVRGRVRLISDGTFELKGPTYRGVSVSMGRTAVLQTGQVHLVLCEAPTWGQDPQLYRSLGLEPADAQIVIVKSPVGFRAGYAPIAKKIVLVDAPGLATSNMKLLDFRRVPRPIFPLDAFPDDWYPLILR